MRIDRKETMLLLGLGIGLLYLNNNNHDINRDGTKDDNDRGLLLLAGAVILMYVL